MQTSTSSPSRPAPAHTADPDEPPLARRFVWQGRVLPAFWTLGSALSIILNIVLVVALLATSRQLFALKDLVQNQLLGGLYYNFILMDQASIETNVVVDDRIPVQFDLRVQADTTVTLTEATPIIGAIVTLTTGGLNIQQAPTNIILPAGTRLPIALDITVPVDTTIPVQLNVPVNIPLENTELHEPFVGLQEVVAPFYTLLNELPDSWAEARCKLGLGGCP
ncbi:MAG: hypothetical protein EPO32_03980 [Anaerolineae bacterium]|nr:MAG: hypothetical protein EPO32_03980 [Anaerolineae bacterium]